jgi:FkbM family methyltransferase
MNPSNMRLRLARANFWLNRLKSLPRAERFFEGVPEGMTLERCLFGGRFLCDVSKDGTQKLLYLTGERFIPEARLVQSLLRPGMKAVDVGANLGYYVLMMNQIIGSTGEITAIEPSEENLPQLRQVVALNNLSNVRVIPKAIGNETKAIGLRAGINSGVTTDAAATYQVEQDTLDNIITSPIDFLKIDIEGYEGAAIKGAIRVLHDYRPILFLEVHPWQIMEYGSSVREILGGLSALYTRWSIHHHHPATNFFQKASSSYIGNLVTGVADRGEYISRCEINPEVPPFWAIFQR